VDDVGVDLDAAICPFGVSKRSALEA